MIDWILLLGILPFGLSSKGILISNIIFTLINLKYLYKYKFVRFELFSSIYIIIYPLMLSGVMKYLFDNDISIYQLYRKMAPLIIAFLVYFIVLGNKRIYSSLIENIYMILFCILILVITSLVFSIELYSHQLNTSDNRFFVYSTSFFLLATLINFKKKYAAIMNLIPLITFSKIILVYYFLYLGFFDNINKHLKLFLMLLVTIIAIKILPRLLLFIKEGDSERMRGINQALPQCYDSITHFLFGHGIGYKYNIETFPIFHTDNFRLAINLQYDVHNFYIDTLFKNGFLYLAFYLYFIIYLSTRMKNKRTSFFILLYFFLSSFSAPTLIGSIEIIGFFLALAILRVQSEAQT